MSESEIIQTEGEAIRKYCRGDRQLAMKVVQDLGASLRNYFYQRFPAKVTSEELCDFIQRSFKQ